MKSIHSIGNASVLYEEDSCPVLLTDPWYHTDRAYHGSWITAHKIPSQLEQSFFSCPLIWISHYHPDHLNIRSLARCNSSQKKPTILCPDHFNNRFSSDLQRARYKVKTLKSFHRYAITESLSIVSIATSSLDAFLVLIVDNKYAYINSNDADFSEFLPFLCKLLAPYKFRFLSRLACWGDVDMINLFDHNGKFIEPLAAFKPSIGAILAASANKIKASHVMAHSLFHSYARTDSCWTNKYVPSLADLRTGHYGPSAYVEPLSSIYISDDHVTVERTYDPILNDLPISPPEDFGDSWSDRPTPLDLIDIQEYFLSTYSISSYVDLIICRFSNKYIFVPIQKNSGRVYSRPKTILFHAPLNSFLRSIRQRTFDDMLISNYMRTYLINYPDLPSVQFLLGTLFDNASIISRNNFLQYTQYYAEMNPCPATFSYLFRCKVNARRLAYKYLLSYPKLMSHLKTYFQHL